MEKDNINQEVEKEKETTEETVEQENIGKDEKTSEKKEEAKENPETDKEDKKKKKGFKKKDKKDEQIEELNDKYQRLFAEFQNFRNRSEKEKTAMYETGARSIIEKILPVVDNFERGVAALSEEDLDSPVGQGMNLIYKQMLQTLEDMGVEAIEAKGNEFDPMLHNAVMHEDNDELGENIVSEELQKGYKYRDTVIRHSMVKVAN
ncbi:nucleotide exchange factor GrpE [Eubacterium sp.]